MGLFGFGRTSETIANLSRAEHREHARKSAQVKTAKRQGKNPVYVKDVKQRHMTGTGRDGRVIKGVHHR